MATTPNQKPVPSEDYANMRFNAGKLDEFMTSSAESYVDRLGQQHPTIKGLAQSVNSLISSVQVTAESIGVVPGLVSQSVALSNANKIMQKASELSALGGGCIVFNSQTYLVHLDPSSYSSSSSTLRVAALYLPFDNVAIKGAGIYSTKIKAFSNDASYGVIQYSKAPLQNGITKVYGVGLTDITIDGNFLWNGTPNVYESECIVGAGMEGLRIRNVRCMNSSHYGMGLQNGGYKACSIDGFISINTGGDGIDIKDNGGISRAFRLNNIYIFNFGQLDQPANPWAGVDIMSIAPQVSNVYVSDFGDVGQPGAGVRIKQGLVEDATYRGSGGVWANVSNITVIQNKFKTSDSETIGFHIKSPFVNYTNVVCMGFSGNIGVGVYSEERYVNGSNIQCSSALYGYRVTGASGTTDRVYGDGESNSVVNITVQNCNKGIQLNRKYQKLINVTLVDCLYGFESGGSSVGPATISGLHLENVTNPFTLLGTTNHRISGVTGPGSTSFQAGVGQIMASGAFARTAILGSSATSLYAGSTEELPGTEVLRATSTAAQSLVLHTMAAGVRAAVDNVSNNGTQTFRWAKTYSTRNFIGAGLVSQDSGGGSPEGVLTAPVGSTYQRSDGAAGTCFYVKESGSGNTGWVAK